MTHHDALEHHRRQLHSEPECYRELAEIGPAYWLPGCVLWGCLGCGRYLAIDPTGLVRETGPLPEMGPHLRAWLEAGGRAIDRAAARNGGSPSLTAEQIRELLDGRD